MKPRLPLQEDPAFKDFNSCFPPRDGWVSRTFAQDPWQVKFRDIPYSAIHAETDVDVTLRGPGPSIKTSTLEGEQIQHGKVAKGACQVLKTADIVNSERNKIQQQTCH